MNKIAVLEAYPWLKDTAPKNVIMGDDLDAGLSTVLYLLQNPNAKLTGVYSAYAKIFLGSNVSFHQLDACVFMDLDIYRENCRSVGHHIVRRDEQDVLTGFRKSFNVNEWEKRSLTSNFTKKYPLGTIHFLMWLYGISIPFCKYAEQLIWLADSAFINGQSHRFRSNVSEWLYHLMPSEDLQSSFQKIGTEQFEVLMEGLQVILAQKGFHKGYGQVQSKHKQLTGYQCQPASNENGTLMTQYIKNLFATIAEITGWRVPDAQLNIESLHSINGTRKSGTIQQVLDNQSIDAFLSQKNVFSYVFPFKDQINYTVFPTTQPPNHP